MAVASVQEVYVVGKRAQELDRTRNIIRRENFPKEVENVTKFDNGKVAITMVEAYDLWTVEEAARLSGFYPVREYGGVTIYTSKSDSKILKNMRTQTIWEQMDYGQASAKFIVHQFHDMYPCQLLNADKRELKVLDNYLRLRNREYAMSRMSAPEKLGNFLMLKGNPDKI